MYFLLIAFILIITWQFYSARESQETFDNERTAWTTERAELLQRIQAPEQAVRDHSRTPDKQKPRVIDVDDDAAFAEAFDS